MRRSPLPALTALRFPAALLVFLCHAPATATFATIRCFAYAAVGFFFLLSGFILTYAYHATFAAPFSWRGAAGFYVARFARIYPMLLVTTLLALAATAAFGSEFTASTDVWTAASAAERVRQVAAEALLLQAWTPDVRILYSVNPPAWSISAEAFFYALFPLIAFALLRVCRTLSSRAVLTAAFAACAVLIAAVAWYPARFNDWALYALPPVRLCDFVIGVLIGIAFLRRDTRRHAEATLAGTRREIVALAAFALLLYLSPFAPMSVKVAALFVPASAAIVYVFALHRGVVSRLLGRAWCVRLGEASFAFYLVHHAVLIVVQHFFGRVPGAAAFTIALGASLAASLLLFAAVESPLRRAIHCWYAAGLRTRVARAIPGVS